MTAADRVTVILCEGYHDRAFWVGLLEAAGWSSPQRGDKGRFGVPDPYLPARPIGGGIFRLDNPDGAAALIVPCHGEGNVLPEAVERMRARETRPVRHLVLNLDVDTSAADDAATRAAEGSLRQSVTAALTRVAPSITQPPSERCLVDGATRVWIVPWRSSLPPTPGVPDQQTLERMVCTALAKIHPERAAHVARWLADRPDGPAAGPKEHAWSHMAGWYAENGCEDFYRDVWRDPLVAAALRAGLEETGDWQIIEAIAR